MHWELLFGVVLFIQTNNILCQTEFGSVFPIPLTVSNDDPNFQQCPMESGAYTHTTNCSLFHMCTFGLHTIYSCIDGFFFNPASGKCQYLPVKNAIKCAEIVKQMADIDLLPPAESVKGYDYYHRRKSVKSQCTQSGIYPDLLDCSLFHYCHRNREHQILKCPNGLHFDPKLFMCSAPQLVNCQYEPSTEPTVTEDEPDSTSTVESNTICRDYTPGTRLPLANKFDEFVICGKNGRSTIMKCQLGSQYNALATNCEMKPCTMNSTLCKNNGECIDASTDKKGFKCRCLIEYQGEYCEKRIELVGTTKSKMETSTEDLLRLANRLTEKNQLSTTNPKINTELLEKPISYTDPKIEDKISIIEKIPATYSPLSRAVHRFRHDYDQERIDEMIKIIFAAMLFLIALILLGSILFGIAVCIRLISSPPVETVGTWNILPEESKV